METAANECCVETEKNGYAWHSQQSNGIYILRIVETRIYMWNTMGILKDQFYGTEKCSSI